MRIKIKLVFIGAASIVVDIENMRQRNVGVDILKCIAAILITNSHMELLHPNDALATGGALGNVLFFFCSGFTLFLKPMEQFDNFYKKRISRIYPTIFAWSVLTVILFGRDPKVANMLLHGGGWFVGCIMTHYVAIYLVGKFMRSRLYMASIVSVIIVLIWYLVLDRPERYNMYGDFSFFRYAYYFLFMLLGALVGVSQEKIKHPFTASLLKLIGCVLLYYVLLYFSAKNAMVEQLQIVSLLPLLGFTFFFYQLANSEVMKKLYARKFSGIFIKIVGGLTLEIYIVQHPLFTDKMNGIYPLNLVIMFIVVVAVAYVLRCVARTFSQIFRERDFEWKAVFKLY